jgi:hypothetical protein
MNYADELKGTKPASEKWRSPFHRQLSRCIQFATDPWFESNGVKRTERQMYDAAYSETCSGPDSERQAFRRNLGTLYATPFPWRVKALDKGWICLDPRQVKEPALPPQSDIEAWDISSLATGIGDVPKDEPIEPIKSQLEHEPESDTQGEQW